MEILEIAIATPCDDVGTAGEKTVNHYLKAMQKEGMDVFFVGIGDIKDSGKVDLGRYGIKNHILFERRKGVDALCRKVHRAVQIVFCPHERYANFISMERRKRICGALKEYKAEGHNPECIILEFTHIILMVEDIKKIFPKSRIIASSHDVDYVGSYRYWLNETNIVLKYFRERQYKNLKTREVDALSGCDVIVLQNDNDLKILRSHKELKDKHFHRIVPYYDDYSDVVRKEPENFIVFYGAMGRRENYRSVQWFIENVFRRLEGYKFVIIGGGVTAEIKKYAGDNILITGFLPIGKIKEYFSRCRCMVVPLQLGSGIKVKILEAFSAGIPVLTNSIGIEGIGAENGKEYVHCDSAQEYINVLEMALRDGRKLEEIGRGGREFVGKKHNLAASTGEYMKFLSQIGMG